MKSLIQTTLNEVMSRVNRQIPQTKIKHMTISILNIRPIDLPTFMKDNEIPESADFEGHDNCYDGWDDIMLGWDIDVPTTESDKQAFVKKRFNDISFKHIYDTLTHKGYMRAPNYNFCELLKEFDNTSVYDMYVNNEFDRLVTYYSMYFKKMV